jgi:hypothetical protein
MGQISCWSADDVNLLEGNIDTLKKKTETVIDASNEIDIQENTEKTSICCCLVTRMTGKQILRKGGTIEIFGNDSDKSKFYSGGN